jgi:hypothetical protein
MNFESRIIPSFLSAEEIAVIEQCVEQHRTPETTHYDTHASGHNAVIYSIFFWLREHRVIADILEPRLQKYFGNNISLDTAHILNAYVPYGIHTDVMSADFDPNSDKTAAWTFIIPLDNYDSNTVVFEQHHETIKTLDVWVDQMQPEPHPIDDVFHQQYLTHVDRLDLQWLTPEAVFPWRQGDLFAADRRKFHTSDNFPARGLECKRAIVIWSTVPKQSSQTA